MKQNTSQKISLPRYLALVTFGKLLIVFSTKVNLLYLLYSTARRCCLLHLIKQNCLLKTFLRTLILMTQVFLYLFFLLELIWNCIIFLQLPRWLNSHNKPWFSKDIWPWLYSSGVSKELWAWNFICTSWTLQYLSERVLFLDCWRITYCPVSLLSVVSKVFERLVNNRILDHLEKCGLFSDFQYDFTSSW